MSLVVLKALQESPNNNVISFFLGINVEDNFSLFQCPSDHKFAQKICNI